MPLTDEAFDKIVLLTRVKSPSQPGEGDEEAAAEAAGPAFDLDEMVEVLEGPFKGMQGPVLSLSEGGDELTLALSVMGRDTPVTLNAEHCEKAA